jgi:DNA-binding MarR family transcriptional regulator
MVERLVQGGLAERREVAGDRRQRRVDLTDAGRERLRFIVDSTASGYVELLSPAPPETLHRLAAVLDELRPFIANRRRLGASGGDGSDG